MRGTLSLGLITLFGYLLGAAMFYFAVTGKHWDAQLLIGSGVFFTCGTVALAAMAVIATLKDASKPA